MKTVIVFILLMLIAVPPLTAAMNTPLKIETGMISGIAGRYPSVTVFKGIPYAAPPVGKMRWRTPAPPAPWEGIRKAENFGPSCIQNIVDERKPWTYEFMTHGEISEDCLSLNVWTAAKSADEKRPVYVYIHGGGFSEGSGMVPVYDGEGLARKGIVVVTGNYRLGLLGFLAHPELTKESADKVSGNYGLLDIIAALRWVRDNIQAFGGDPDRVTIGGQSAGGMAVHSMIASPLARGLFHCAVVESGGSSLRRGGAASGSRGLAEAETNGVRFSESKDAETLAELRTMTWQKLTEPVPGEGLAGMLRYSPVVDGHVLPADAQEVVAQGKQNDVPVLTGVNSGELGGILGPQAPVTAESFLKQTRTRYGTMADVFLRLYPAVTDEEAQKAQLESSRDQSLVSLYLWSKHRARTSGTEAFLYLWDHALPGPDAERFGAFHTGEVPYFMNTLYMSDRPFVEADRKIADMMSSYLANFIATGDPNGNGLPRWAPASDKPEIMEIGDKTGPIPAAFPAARYAFFEKHLTGEQ